MGEAGLRACLDRAPPLEMPGRGALVFPHTRLEATGDLVAAVAQAVVRAGAGEVLALGVLHGARVEDAALVRQARVEGDAAARQRLRRVHGPGVPGDEGHWTEEFSLDGFLALLALAAARAGRKMPRVLCRYPFLVGETPGDLPGLEELRRLVARGVAVVATTDPVHHGRGYGDPPERSYPAGSARADTLLSGALSEALLTLRGGDFTGFQRVTERSRSDFRDVGPVLACLLAEGGAWRAHIHAERRVDYAAALGAEEPTWVGAALVSCAHSR